MLVPNVSWFLPILGFPCFLRIAPNSCPLHFPISSEETPGCTSHTCLEISAAKCSIAHNSATPLPLCNKDHLSSSVRSSLPSEISPVTFRCPAAVCSGQSSSIPSCAQRSPSFKTISAIFFFFFYSSIPVPGTDDNPRK